MKKFLAVLTVLVAIVVIIPGLAGASNWTKYHDDDEENPCWHCGGSGKCEVCEGEGYYEEERGRNVKCYRCDGTGKCYYCDGKGY